MTDYRQTSESSLRILADRLIEVVDRVDGTHEVESRFGEISHLLWLASSLDPEVGHQMGRTCSVLQSPLCDEI